MNAKDIAEWMSLEDRELVYCYQKLHVREKSILIKFARLLAEEK